MERDLSLYGQTFTVPTKFTAGPRDLSEGEAAALQSVFRNNLNNLVAGRAKKLMNGSDTLTDEQAATLQSTIADYARTHTFGRRVPAGADPVEQAALKMLKEVIRGQAKNASADAVTRAATEVRDHQPDKWAKYCDLARRRLESEAQMKQLELALAAEVATPFGLGASPPS
jgi:hypothetical protein